MSVKTKQEIAQKPAKKKKIKKKLRNRKAPSQYQTTLKETLPLKSAQNHV
jgi:hypothetical protein